MTSLGKTVQIVRQAKRMKLKELASKAGISSPFLSLVEGGERQPSIEVAGRLAEALGIPLDVLILAGQGSRTSLSSSDGVTNKLLDSIEKMSATEKRLQKYLNSTS